MIGGWLAIGLFWLLIKYLLIPEDASINVLSAYVLSGSFTGALLPGAVDLIAFVAASRNAKQFWRREMTTASPRKK